MLTRRAFLALPIVLSLGLAGCGGGGTNLPTPAPNVPNARGPAPLASELRGRIVYAQSFSSEIDGQFRQSLYVANADGTNVVRLTPSTLKALSGTRVAPDGSRVNFSDTDGTRYVVNLDGSGLQSVGTGGRFGARSPDGATVAYSVVTDAEDFRDRRGEIFLAPADGSGAPRLFGGAGQYNYSPAFAPDGRSLIYVAQILIGEATYRYDIIVAPLDGGQGRVLVSNDEGIYDVIFAPDGRRIAYTQLSGQSNRFGTDIALYTADSAGGNRRLIADDTDTSALVFSPDGRFIAYNAGSARYAASVPDSNTINIFIARADGSSASRLFRAEAGRGSQYSPEWIR